MWSECPLANGSYVFETQLPQREVDAAHHLSVIVRRCTPLQDARIAPVLHRRTVSVSDSR
ncbi:MAG TPA: hypothetical protein VFZ21_32575, partial [Gemmatimonadaceae bacterium]|nr:hypothetical protein [Gemmatimonadaceae bacterium]